MAPLWWSMNGWVRPSLPPVVPLPGQEVAVICYHAGPIPELAHDPRLLTGARPARPHGPRYQSGAAAWRPVRLHLQRRRVRRRTAVAAPAGAGAANRRRVGRRTRLPRAGSTRLGGFLLRTVVA